jgi:hypothetical protein
VLRVSGATSVTLLVSIGTSYVDFRTVDGDYQNIARTRLGAAGTAGYEQLRARHLADYQALFNRVTIDLGRTAAADQTTDVRIAQHASTNDPQLSALLFQYGRYLLISSSRPGTQPANLQGIWNEEMAPPPAPTSDSSSNGSRTCPGPPGPRRRSVTPARINAGPERSAQPEAAPASPGPPSSLAEPVFLATTQTWRRPRHRRGRLCRADATLGPSAGWRRRGSSTR